MSNLSPELLIILNEINSLRDQVLTLSTIPSASGHPPAAASTIKDPKIPHIDTFSGSRRKADSWLTSLFIFLKAQPNRYPTDQSRVLYAACRLRGNALNWFKRYLSDDREKDPLLHDFSVFIQEFKALFGYPNEIKNAERSLIALTQKGSYSEYAARFISLASKVKWNDAALIAQFEWGLKDKNKDSFGNHSL